MKKNWFIIPILCLFLLTACGGNKEEMAQAWAACETASGDTGGAKITSGEKISGKIYEIDSIDGAEPAFNIGDDAEGKYSMGNKYTDDFLYAYHNFTSNLSKATSVLCIKVKTNYYLTCNYPSDAKIQYTIRYFHTEAQLTLLAWPSGELIASGDLVDSENSCPGNVLYESGEKSRNAYDLIGMEGWLAQYIIPAE